MNNNKCPRTGRLCVGGAYDGGDGFDIDCPSASPETCVWLKDAASADIDGYIAYAIRDLAELKEARKRIRGDI